MNEEIHFPRELLLKTDRDRMHYFESLTIAHPKLLQCTKKLVKAIKQPTGFSIIMVMGPTGVGKTTLIKKVLNLIVEEMNAATMQDRGCIPIAAIELPAPDSGIFNWKDYYKRALVSLSEPLIDYKIDYERYKKGGNNEEVRIVKAYRDTAPELRRSLENAFMYRKPAAFIIDEAQHFAKMASGRRLQDQLDTIKSISNITKVTHVLVGNYELTNFVDLSGQLSRRTMDVRFSRYVAGNEEDLDEFLNVVYTFQKLLPLEIEPDLLKYWEYIYEHTLGCIGIFRDWLVRSLELAFDISAKTIDYEILNQTALSSRKIGKIAEEIFYGEKILSDNEENKEYLRSVTGMHLTSDSAVINSKEKKGNKKPGKRKPVRDPIGVGQNAK